MVAEIFLTSSVDRKYWDKQPAWTKRTLAHLPAAHIAGVVNYFAAQFSAGATTYWMPKFEFGDFVKHIQALQVNIFFTVPPIYMAIAKHPAVKEQFFPMRQATVGAAPVSAEMRTEANKKMPNLVIGQVWGMSETTGAATYTAVNSQEQAGSLGELLPNLSVRYSSYYTFSWKGNLECVCVANVVKSLVDEEGNDTAPGEPGEILIKGPIVTQGYHRNPEANEKTFTTDGWMRTGDIMRIDSNNLYHIVDRKKVGREERLSSEETTPDSLPWIQIR